MKTLLIVDDELLIAEGLHDMLAEAFSDSMQVLCCYSAAEALEIAGRIQVDILLTDINMPECSGLELHREIMKKHPECRVIYLTGYSDFEYARQAVDQHAFAYVLKGEGDDQVIETIRRAAQGQEGKEKEEDPELTEGTASVKWLKDLQTYILSHLSEDLSLNHLADICHFHPVYLSRAYREITGMTLSEYISSVKLDRACRMLRGSTLTVLEISRMLGFATDNYFCRWFRKQSGRSPHSYRAGRN